MITLAILYWLASKIGGTVGVNWFYEQLPVDPNTGKLESDGVYGQTVQAPRVQGQDLHTFITLYVVVANGVTDQNGNPVPSKQATDDLADSIEDAVSGALDDSTSWTLTVPPTGQKFTDVRILTSTGKNTMPMMANGAIVKSLEIEVWYKKG